MIEYYIEFGEDLESSPPEIIKAKNDVHAVYLATKIACYRGQTLMVVYQEMEKGNLRIVWDCDWDC